MTTHHVIQTPLSGVKLVHAVVHSDNRGVFLKPFNENTLLSNGIIFNVAEHFISCSSTGVLRGMHFQAGQSAHAKLVSCINGRILDVVVDVRPDSPEFNRPFGIELSPAKQLSVFIDKGYAHGFLALEDDSWVSYLTTVSHCPTDDKGVLWSSIDFDWPMQAPCLSNRDKNHPAIGAEKCEFF